MATGKWTALDSGIGGGVDSYFEYLVKGSFMFNNPELLEMFRGKSLFFHKSLHLTLSGAQLDFSGYTKHHYKTNTRILWLGVCSQIPPFKDGC